MASGGSSLHISQREIPAPPPATWVDAPAVMRDTVPIPDIEAEPDPVPAPVVAPTPVVVVVREIRPAAVDTSGSDPVIVAVITAAADEFDVDTDLMTRIMHCESRLNPDAENRSSGAAGLGQHLPQYWAARAAAIGMAGASPFEPVANARVTAWMLSTQGTAPWASSRACWKR